jgi:hypothetical protein
MTNLSPSVSRLSRRCGILYISEPYVPPHSITEIAPLLHFITLYFIILHNEELHDLYSSPSIIRIIKSRRIRWAGHVARMGEKKNVYRLSVGKPEGRRPLGIKK